MADANLSTELVKAVLAVVLLPLAFVLVGALLAAGPVGWVLLFALGAVVVASYSWWTGGVEMDRPELVNCGDCGAPNDSGNEVCEYCEAAL